MRKLTIQRRKTFVASAMKMKVYLEDKENGDLDINGCMCRKVGEVKNNSEVVIEIENNEVKVFVIADKMTKDFCNDMLVIPEGEEDIVVSGKNKFSPSRGNPFIFDR